ncbi:sulfate permease [Hysterangium stoloniferum]|nr:sulfate permease [Hysterangium stoloniferum]
MANTSDTSIPQPSLPFGTSDRERDSLQARPSSIRGEGLFSDVETGEQATQWILSSRLGGDFLAGVTLACILVPQSISYATSLAKLSPLTGLFSASIPGLIYSVLGSSRQLNVGPEAALSLLVGQAVQDILGSLAVAGSDQPFIDFIKRNPENVAIAIGTIITLQAALITLLLGIFRLGFIDVILSRALLRGYVTAIAIVIFIDQCIPIFGLSALQSASSESLDSTLNKALFLIKYIFIDPRAHWLTASIGFGTMALLVVVRSAKRSASKRFDWPKWIPEVTLVVIVLTVLSAVLDWEKAGVAILGRVKPVTDSTLFAFPINGLNFKLFKRTASTALLISVIGFLDSVAAAKENSVRFGYSISPNRELVALGAGNFVASFVPGTLPAYGTITRSRLNGDCGASTQMASIICSILVLLATFFLLQTLYYVPKVVLASMVCVIIWGLLAEAPHDIKYYIRMKAWMELSLVILTLVLTIAWNVEVGVLASVAISLLLVVKESSQTRMSILGRIPGTDQWKPINENTEAVEPLPGVLIVQIRESLNFANSALMEERLRRLEIYGIERRHPSEAPTRQHAQVIVFQLADMENCDVSATQVFFDLLRAYKNRAVHVFICHLRPGPRAVFEKAGVIDFLGRDTIFENVASATQHIELLELAQLGRD